MPIDYKKYPKNWKWLSKQIRQRAKNKCELCFVENGSYRAFNKVEYLADAVESFLEQKYENKELIIGDDASTDKTYQWTTKIVLTVHHINFDITDNHELNLIALCQRCHLRLDIREKLRRRKK